MAFFSSCVYLSAAMIHVLVNYRLILVLIICLSWMFLEVARSDLAWENIFDVNIHRFSLRTFFWSLYKRQTFLTMQSFSNCAIVVWLFNFLSYPFLKFDWELVCCEWKRAKVEHVSGLLYFVRLVN